MALLAVTAVVCAQVVRVVGTRGYGFAGPEGDQPVDSQFLFHVHRVLRPDTQPSPVRGSFQFRVEDNTPPDSIGNAPDRLRVEFFAVNSSTPSFTYEGVVKRGDIEVFALNATP
ncbi:MAG: hypothetical protein RMJ83_10490 [Armatimonadota bacterium]|nr:hypothetical protein [Armatimonadota bacterium]